MTLIDWYKKGQDYAKENNLDNGIKVSAVYRIINESRDMELLEALYDAPKTELFFMAGATGHEIPKKVTGWRYGNLPESGKSWNYRDNEWESGVSMIETDDGDRTESTREFIFDGRPIVKAIGYKHFYAGSDGEPILVGAVEIK